MASASSRSTPIKLDAELGAKLYAPTPTNAAYRLDYVDPFSGERRQPRRTDRTDAFALWDEVIEYLRTAQLAVPLRQGHSSGRRRGSGPTVDDLFDERVQRWTDEACRENYIQNRSQLFDYRIRPVCGSMEVREWARTDEVCREVIRSARAQGLARSTIQDLGALMRNLVTVGWVVRWIPPGHNPMRGVKYTKGAEEQGQSAEFVPEDDRPEFEAVERLYEAYESLAVETGILWLPTRTRVAAQAGLRPGEQNALRLCDLRPDDLEAVVDGSISWVKGRGPVRTLPKNGKRRRVLVTASLMEELERLASQRRADGAADDALLFEDPCHPGRPISESATVRLHNLAAIRAGWETVEVRRDPTARRALGPDVRPRHTNYSLRHHAATWMHDVAGFDWTDVSLALGHHSVAFTYGVYVRAGSEARARNRARLAEM